jgi:dTDP-4-amino-4,6-dideoxygalactose transaminase
LIAYCLKNGVHTNVHYKPLNMMTVNKYYQYQAPLPNSYAQYNNEISLPLHSGMSLEDVEYVVEVLLKGLEL